jgi:hypothetical protein
VNLNNIKVRNLVGQVCLQDCDFCVVVAECASDKRKSCREGPTPWKWKGMERSGFLLLNRIDWSTTIFIDLPSIGLSCLCVKESCFGSRLRSRKSLQASALDRPDFLERKASEWMNEICWMNKSLWLRAFVNDASFSGSKGCCAGCLFNQLVSSLFLCHHSHRYVLSFFYPFQT